jgi:acetyl esterase/lipase
MSNAPLTLPPIRAGHAAPEELLKIRSMIGSAPSRFPAVERLQVDEERLGGVRAVRVALAGTPKATVLHFHGGGFRMGAAEMSVGFGSMLAARTGAELVAPDYRLAPENPYPCGLADALAVLEALSPAEKARLVISGDSAGGGLAASLTLLALSRGMLPLGVMLFSPWLDLTVSSPCYAENTASDPLFSLASAQAASALYLQGHPPTDPLASPLFGDVSGFPPTLISVSEHEVLRDDSLSYAAALVKAGRDVTLVATPHMEHTAVTRDPALVGAAEGLEAVFAFLTRISN